jgi:hypothetical protein
LPGGHWMKCHGPGLFLLTSLRGVM